jgi:hypothetical protein
MTQDEIIKMAYEAGIIQPKNVIKTLEAFAKLVAQHEREWVELDEEDYIKAYELCDFDKDAAFEFFENKLKEKNT